MQCAAANQRTRQWGPGIAIVAFAWSLLVGGETFAQSPSTFSQDFRLWSPVYLTVKLPSSFLAYMEVNPRFADLDDAGHIDQLVLRPAFGYQLTENISIWQGYAWVGNFNQRHTPPQSPFFEENRIYQQVNYKHKFSHLKFLSRTRLEERWIEHADGTAVRFRQMFRADFPIPQAPDWAFVVYDEIFINLNTVGVPTGKGPGAGIDQNRFFLGINKTFSQYFNVDMGYQNQMLNSRNLPGNANLINHTFLLQFFINL
jgi:hypothetical protein